MAFEYGGSMIQEGNVETLSELLADLYGTAAELRLYKSSFSPNQASEQADFEAEEADYSGYAAVPLTWGAEGLDNAGNAVSFSNRAVFQNTTGVVANSIGGAWVAVETSAGPPAVVVAMRYFAFPAPVPLATALATLGAVVVANAPNLNGSIIVDS